ncbi:MAG: hypothetical protein ACE5Z5_12795 [Candidatus Bathyarchaeia archaeon]
MSRLKEDTATERPGNPPKIRLSDANSESRHSSQRKRGFQAIAEAVRTGRVYNLVPLFTAVAAIAAIAAAMIEIYVVIEFHRFYHLGLALVGIMMVILSVQCITTVVLLIMMNNVERRMRRMIRGQKG